MAHLHTVDAIGRRSRFKRTPTGKRIFLTTRDADILRWLYRYRFMRTTQLVAFLKPKSEKRFIERLGDLYHEVGLIDRPKPQWRSADARYRPLIYELSRKGQQYLSDHGEPPHRVTSLARRGRPGATPQFEHAMMIVDALAQRELQTIAEPDRRFVSVDEILQKAPSQTPAPTKPLAIPVTVEPCRELPNLRRPFATQVVPDGLCGIEHLIDGEKKYRFYALECENQGPVWRSTALASSLALKRAAYAALTKAQLHRKIWGIPNVELVAVRRRVA